MSRFLSEAFKSHKAYVPGAQPQNSAELIKLNTNENPYPPSPGVLQALKSELRLSLYPDPEYKELTSAIGAYHGLLPSNVCPSNGSDEILGFCFWGLCENGCAFPEISYGFYKIFADAFGIEKKAVPLCSDFSIDIQDYAGIKSTVFIANPNAPTGLYLPLSDIEGLLQQDRDRLLIIDEAYIDFGGVSAVDLMQLYDNLLVIRTMSKSRSLAGARLGYALGCPELIEDLNSIRFNFNPYNINRMSALAGAASIVDNDWFEECCCKIISAREYTITQLRGLGFKVTDSLANFAFAGEHPDIHAADFCQKLFDRNILVRYFNTPTIDNYVRISIGTMEQMEHLISVTGDILREVRHA